MIVSTIKTTRQDLYDLSDLDMALIRAVAHSFIHEYGALNIETGKEALPHETTMRHELQKMLTRPELGMRQIVPLIAMWVEQFNLKFEDPLFKLEVSRLKLKQTLADQLNNLISLKRPVTVNFSVLEVLSMLESNEMMESVPYIEFQIKNQLPNPPKDTAELIQRIRELAAHSEKTIEIKLTPDMFTQPAKAEESLEEKARKWLEKTQAKYQYNLNAFFKEYDKLSKPMKEAVNEIMDENIEKSSQQRPQKWNEEEYQDTYSLLHRVLIRLFKWFQRS